MKLPRAYQNKINNAQGHLFEDNVKKGCRIYLEKGIAKIEKVPEPFCVYSKQSGGMFKGRFTANAEPDYMGTLKGGRSICFEAKYTANDRILQDTVTETQSKALETYFQMGAKAGVCCCITDRFFFIPWVIWRDMKKLFGRKYILAAEAKQYEVKFDGAVHFLDYKRGQTK